ncbi:dephospho-CoA kinase [Marinagarivorans cellulosilyticus]|uniref:Dephospho-CoA kinase n=1 Tax=Marinagarivorans cellulosilyticus TaxID=2721545 RepID=A0AAN2BIP8_9GAMM|nr:dephospho-CoA kinase [Marinagarivorans cellulosilyticus]BCD96091.1 dephospho-CoA kinase [Marinagarivorans cellulosilyticus]
MIVGLTGGIGSGKSTVAGLFSKLGIEWVDLDIVARQVVERGEPALTAITQRFSATIPSIQNANGELNRTALRHYIFQHPDEKAWLETLLHPLIQKRSQMLLSKTQSPYVLLISPLLFEKNTPTDKSISIDVDKATQISRATSRDGNTPEQIKRIMATQLSRQERNQRADYIIDNSHSLSDTERQVYAIHQMLISLL